MLLSQVPSCRSDDRPFADYNFAPLPDGLPDVVFAYELRRFFGTWRRHLAAWPAPEVRRGVSTGAVSPFGAAAAGGV